MNELLYKSVENDTPSTTLPVKGSIPSWLKGDFFRNGPAKFELGKYQLNHWFDGFSVLHKFELEEGTVKYKSKFLQSEDYITNLKEGKIKSRHYGTVPDPCGSLFQKFFSAFKIPNPDNANVSVVKVGNSIAAVSDFSTMVEFDYNTLETKGRVKHRDVLGNKYMFSASHPSFDPTTGEFYNCAGMPGPKGKIHVFKMKEEPFKREMVGLLKLPRHTYYHSFAITKKYFIFIEQPLELNIWKLMFGRVLNTPYEGSYNWRPENGMKFHLLDRKTGAWKVFKTDSFFFFHSVNAFDQEESVIVDLCLYPNPRIIDLLYIKQLKENGLAVEDMAQLNRISINLETGKVDIESLSRERFDLPTFNFDKGCQRYQYVYGLGFRDGISNDVNNQLIKIDISGKTTLKWYEHGKYPSEPIFVQAPDAAIEDEGVILSVVLDTEKQSSFLLVLNAVNFQELARADAPVHLPIGLHGMFYSKK